VPASYDPLEECPTFLSFLKQILQGKQEVIRFLQRAIGYSLTGVTVERCIFILWGGGKNGKSTLLDTILTFLADHAARTNADTLMASRDNQIPNDVARLKGMRFVFASEGRRGGAWPKPRSRT
jgi:putative DNA primase/helicase